MTDKTIEKVMEILSVVFLAGFFWFIGFAIGDGRSEDAWRKDMIRRGLAEYRIDPVTAKVTFCFKGDE